MQWLSFKTIIMGEMVYLLLKMVYFLMSVMIILNNYKLTNLGISIRLETEQTNVEKNQTKLENEAGQIQH